MNKYKCLILDDDEAFCFWLESKIKKNLPDLELIGSFHSTLEGILTISREKPELLFLDMNIDGLNGLDVLQIMKYEPLTIVISSDQHELKDFQENSSIGAFLQKPFTVEELVKVVTQVTEKL